MGRLSSGGLPMVGLFLFRRFVRTADAGEKYSCLAFPVVLQPILRPVPGLRREGIYVQFKARLRLPP